MSYCSRGHGLKTGSFCDECGAELLPAPPGDSVRLRSPEAHASASVSPTFVLPGGHAPGAPLALVRCPHCGRRNGEGDTFDCQGPCSRTHLCLRHFDEEFEVCRDCAAARRGDTARAQAERAALLDDLAGQRARAETAEAALAQAQAAVQRLQKEQQALLAKTAAADAAHAEAMRRLQEQLAGHQSQLTAATAKGQELEAALAAAKGAGARLEQERDEARRTGSETAKKLQRELAASQKELAAWRTRAETAEAALAPYRRREEEARRREEEERRAGAARPQKPLWQEIGIDLVKIPAGGFLYGDDKQKLKLDEFWIAKTPVTVAQFRRFAEATGYVTTAEKEGSAWGYDGKEWKEIKGANWRQPRGPGSNVDRKQDHPVTCVSWHDAQAFCQWVGLRLPTEQQWEKAARGADGRIYPWGNEAPDAQRCSFAMKVGDTTPVGNYPAGSHGLFDMAGNVWEWCEDFYDSSQAARVLRGGAFSLNENLVRCASRGRSGPFSRTSMWGFGWCLPAFDPLGAGASGLWQRWCAVPLLPSPLGGEGPGVGSCAVAAVRRPNFRGGFVMASQATGPHAAVCIEDR